MKNAIIVIVLFVFIAGCGHETTLPGTWNGQPLSRTMTVTVNNIPTPEAPPNIEIKVVGGFTQKDAAPLTIYSVTCSGKYRQLYLEGVGVLQCDADDGDVKTVAAPQGQWN